MQWVALIIAVVTITIIVLRLRKTPKMDLVYIPERFVVFDLETTGLNPAKNEIIEIGAIRANRDSSRHDTFQVLVKPSREIASEITALTGITQEMVDQEGDPIDSAILEFITFLGDLPLVSFNADFDMAFMKRAAARSSLSITNPVICALEMARRAWPGRHTYRLAELAKDGGLSEDETHRALGDCQRTLIVYAAAAARLRAPR